MIAGVNGIDLLLSTLGCDLISAMEAEGDSEEPWLLEEGVWNDEGRWLDDAAWND